MVKPALKSWQQMQQRIGLNIERTLRDQSPTPAPSRALAGLIPCHRHSNGPDAA